MGQPPPDPTHDSHDQRPDMHRPGPQAAGRAGTPALAAGNPHRGRRGVTAAWLSLAGIGGATLCSAAMLAASLGLFTTAAASAAHRSMPAMGTPAADGGLPAWLDALVRLGPQLLVASLALLAAGIGLRRPAALIPATAGGAILYVGMYQQQRLAWMYAAIAAGTALLLLAHRTSRPPRPSPARPQPRRR